ncbi:MAG: hypothetical protein R3174_12080 [Gammaproteobacteria bacterium]|nr:hypothetical protein [Gammaproteobacteria bacterium]
MSTFTRIEAALRAKWTSVYVRILAIVLACGALAHLANMLGLSGASWSQSPAAWRLMDVTLLLFNLTVGAGLWWRRVWAVVALVAGMFSLQLVPYTVFRAHFAVTPEHAQTLDALLATEGLLIGILVLLIALKK